MDDYFSDIADSGYHATPTFSPTPASTGTFGKTNQ